MRDVWRHRDLGGIETNSWPSRLLPWFGAGSPHAGGAASSALVSLLLLLRLFLAKAPFLPTLSPGGRDVPVPRRLSHPSSLGV